MKIETVQRMYVLTFGRTGTSYPVTSTEAQRLLDEYPAITATKYRVVLRGHSAGERNTLRPASVGGGVAFIVERGK